MEKTQKYYVVMTDKFMSGWGISENKINKYIIVCDNFSNAEIIKKSAKKRSEMKYINIHTKKPYYNKNHYLISLVKFNELGSIWTNK
tara:strand:+ start:361 stop:621 length:261 start_codon:yes stop_codon:yes gene_type:complete